MSGWQDGVREALSGLGYDHGQVLDIMRRIVAPVVEAEVRRGQAEAWGDGFDAGHETSRAVNNEWPQMPRNPYAIEAGDPR